MERASKTIPELLPKFRPCSDEVPAGARAAREVAIAVEEIAGDIAAIVRSQNTS
jgi:hypothetical protein